MPPTITNIAIRGDDGVYYCGGSSFFGFKSKLFSDGGKCGGRLEDDGKCKECKEYNVPPRRILASSTSTAQCSNNNPSPRREVPKVEARYLNKTWCCGSYIPEERGLVLCGYVLTNTSRGCPGCGAQNVAPSWFNRR